MSILSVELGSATIDISMEINTQACFEQTLEQPLSDFIRVQL